MWPGNVSEPTITRLGKSKGVRLVPRVAVVEADDVEHGG
jgi:hypothetical protein